jgi:hypothetical protein
VTTSISPARGGAGSVATSVRVDARHFWVELADGRVLGVPWSRFNRLAAASDDERRAFVLSKDGRNIHWPDLDEDVGVELLLYYTPPPAAQRGP